MISVSKEILLIKGGTIQIVSSMITVVDLCLANTSSLESVLNHCDMILVGPSKVVGYFPRNSW